MVDKMRTAPRKQAEREGARESLYSAIRVRLPTFAILVLRRRAADQKSSVSAVVEALILDEILLDEVERMVKQSPEFKRVAIEWMREAVVRKRR